MATTYPDMTERFKQLDQRHERLRLEREALDYLLAWHTEKDPSKRSAAWHRLIAATNELAEFESQHLLKK